MILTVIAEKQAGMVGLLAALSEHYVAEVMTTTLGDLVSLLRIPRITELRGGDLLLCIHGRTIIPDSMLARFHYGGVNIHPCLWAYKGANPIQRAIQARDPRVSVGAHRMTDRVDKGPVLVEHFLPRPEGTVVDVYNALYPLYARVVIEALRVIHDDVSAEHAMAVEARDAQLSEISKQSNALS